mgnify:CR=1 FL=1
MLYHQFAFRFTMHYNTSPQLKSNKIKKAPPTIHGGAYKFVLKDILHQLQTDKTALQFIRLRFIVILSTCLSVILHNYTLLYQESQYFESNVMYN